MITQDIILKNEEGIHARPATEIVKNSSKYNCDIKLEVNGKEFNAKSVLNIMSAGIKNNSQIKIVCDGIDEEKALAEVLATFKNNSLI